MVWKAGKKRVLNSSKLFHLDLYPEIGNYVDHANIEQLISLSKRINAIKSIQWRRLFWIWRFHPWWKFTFKQKEAQFLCLHLNTSCSTDILLLVQNIFFIQDEWLIKHCKWKDKGIIPKPRGLGEVWRDNSDLNLF